MITNKDVRVENGNLILNGDKYPLDGQSPEAIMSIVEDNSDTTPTENSTNPVKSGGVFNADHHIAGDVITAENVVAAAVGSNTSDCYFSVPLSKPVSASSVAISSASCNLYYGTNQRETVENATYTATIQNGSLLVKMEKASTFSQYGRYIVDFTGTFTFS